MHPVDEAAPGREREGHDDHASQHGHGGHEQHGGHDHTAHHRQMMADFRRRFWVSLVVTLPILALSPMIQGWLGLGQALAFAGENWVRLGLGTVVFFYGGWPFLRGLVDELRQRQPGMMTLIGLAITVAYGYSATVSVGVSGRVFFWELTTLVDVMLVGHWIEMRSVIGASGALDELVELMPAEAHRLTGDGSVEQVEIEDLAAGDRVLVKPGEKVPADGTVVEGSSSVDESMITGESTPVRKQAEAEVVGGAINGEAALTVAVEKTGQESYLAQMVELVRRSRESRSRSQDTADRAAFWLTIAALSAGAATLAGWLLGGRELVFAVERSVTVMVITCPHALGLAVPLVVAVSTALAARNGLLVRNRADFERARALDAVVFDKTGTLTEGRFGVSAVATAEGIDEREAVRLAAGVEQGSQHPIGRGILDYARQQDIDPAHASDHQSIPGRGARAEADGRSLLVVGQLYLDEHDIAAQSADVVLVRSDPRDLVAVLDLAGATRRKMVQNLWWAAGYNIAAIPLAAGVLAPVGVLLSPAVGALLMSASTVIVAVNARLLGRTRLGPDADA